MSSYDHRATEAKWQERWERGRVAEVDLRSAKDKFYMLMMFPYPSGDRLHVGHGRNYILGDALYRYSRLRGRRALNPMGWDSFGLPAENAAIQRGIHPRDWTLENIRVMKKQFRRWGILYDWSKEVTSCLPDYYRWNQWLFLRMLERGLAYKKRAPVNWCPSCRTVLANEQVIDGACERCGTPVEPKDLEQWFLRITDFADRLLAGLDELPGWPEKVKVMQRNWIGRSEGAEIEFAVEAGGAPITVFTTRPDTLHGATFLVLAPEHPRVAELTA
ncbi:MAG TPA: class I tRNA ligase family protein, partial [Thermoanaerobaculia bacterium]|nr:class I tRNA ligase family protein [Thermoanaerobaculia bacterium]